MLRVVGAFVVALTLAACTGGSSDSSASAQSAATASHQPVDLKRGLDAPRPPGTSTLPSEQRSVPGRP